MVPPRATYQGPAPVARPRPRRVAHGRPSSTSSPRSPTGRGIRLRTGAVVVRIHAGGLTMRRRSIGRTAGCYPDNAGSTPAVAAPFLGRLIGRIFGSEPKDAWFESRPRSSYGRGHGVHAVSNTAGEGSIPSVRAQHTSGTQCIVRDARGCGRRPALPAGRPTSSDRCATARGPVGEPWGSPTFAPVV